MSKSPFFFFHLRSCMHAQGDVVCSSDIFRSAGRMFVFLLLVQVIGSCFCIRIESSFSIPGTRFVNGFANECKADEAELMQSNGIDVMNSAWTISVLQ